ncbi:MAG: alanine--tRNA ligase [candidate division WOR-3 bacterium]|nr:alanine--tRNA ligase [candidate division WOR-3 bacterium]MCX7836534.1 alanine--tRNA ligase [candidate division WOR-3 bacterium]MDW8113772.1 alanine--tRNA ligase [candidate division WOR-3 bacterium]
MKAQDLRISFLNFYKERDHTVVPSSSLVPRDDPTLLFTTAGMVQFKPLYAGIKPLPYKRATSCQKCLRLTDLEKVGFSPKYCTFFEMLGNFSFGDYFKKEALIWAWEYLTEILKLDKKRLYVSVFKEDDEAYDIWHKIIGLEENRIYRLGEEDNFWGPAGGVGACGPSSEIYYDLGEEFGCGKEECAPGCSCDRFLELYNIVFPMYDQQPDGQRLPLKNRGIDTGMGLERLAMVIQNKKTIFETDLFDFIVKKLEKILNIEKSDENKPFFYVTSDHLRALTFAICDGVLPSNEERGYVLRLLLRRTLILYYKFLKEFPQGPFLYQIPSEIIYHYSDFYPELKEGINKVPLIIKEEEERFLFTIKKAIFKWEEVISEIKRKGEKVISGEKLFFLHDTFGLNIEIMEELAKSENLLLDIEGFKKKIEERKRERISVSREIPKENVEFCGYDKLEVESEVISLKKISPLEYEIILNPTPFYSEKGGQIGDTGKIIYENLEIPVIDSYYQYQVPVHKIKMEKEIDLLGKKVLAVVDKERRYEIMRAHTTTHLLHKALKLVLGEEVRQEGSLVDVGRLHFDFNFYRSLKEEEILEIEKIIFQKILQNIRVEKYYNLPLAKAKEMGAIALFLEEYGEYVNVIKIGDFSLEVCGGTHLDYTGEIGLFKIVNETSIAAGIRRIEGYCGKKAFEYLLLKDERLKELRKELQVSEENLLKKIREIVENLKEEEKKRKKIVEKYLPMLVNNLSGKKILEDIELIIEDYSFLEKEEIRRICDYLKDKEKKIAILFRRENENWEFVIFVSKDLREKIKAKDLAKKLGEFLEGGGGGREDLAEGGGKIRKLSEIKDFIKKLINY